MLSQESESYLLCLAEPQDRQGVGVVYGGKRRKASGTSSWRLPPVGSWKLANCKWGILHDWFEEHIRFSLSGPELGAGRQRESWQSLTKSCLFGVDLYRACGLPSSPVCCRD